MAIVKTMNVDRDVVFSDGEGLVSADLNNLQARITDTFLIELIQMCTELSPTNFRPVGPCLSIGEFVDSGGVGDSTITLRPGTALVNFGSGFAPVIVPESTTITPTNPTTARKDLISVTFSDTTESASRNFEDASTGALTTSLTTKSNRYVVEIHVTEGVDSGSPTPPAVPVGHFPILTYQVTNGASGADLSITNNVDYRVPAGHTIFTPFKHSLYDSLSGGTQTYPWVRHVSAQFNTWTNHATTAHVNGLLFPIEPRGMWPMHMKLAEYYGHPSPWTTTTATGVARLTQINNPTLVVSDIITNVTRQYDTTLEADTLWVNGRTEPIDGRHTPLVNNGGVGDLYQNGLCEVAYTDTGAALPSAIINYRSRAYLFYGA